MPPKRSKSGANSASGHRWEQALLSAPYAEEDKWTATVHLVVGSRVEDYNHVNHLVSAINGGSRRRFTVITKDSLFEQVDDLGNPKNRKGKEAPAFYEICEACKPFIDNGEDLPVLLLAKLLKFKLLELKVVDINRRESENKAVAEKTTEKGKKGEKGKERAKSPSKGKAGKKTPDPSSPKTQSKLRKRGDDDTDGKYIDDEPDDGPHQFTFIVGFHHPHLLSLLCDMGVQIDSVIKIESEDYSRFGVAVSGVETGNVPAAETKDEKTLAAEEEVKRKEDKLRVELEIFWKDVLLLMRQPHDDSKLHDVARLQYTVKESIIPENMEETAGKEKFSAAVYEEVACMVFNLLDAKRQWRTYLENVKLIHIPGQAELSGVGLLQDSQETGRSVSPSGGAGESSEALDLKTGTPDVDMRHYNELINSVPQECTSVPLVMHCMLEQIVATEEDRDPVSEVSLAPRVDGLDDDLASHISAMAYKLGLSEEEHQELGSSSSHVVLTNISRQQQRSTELMRDPNRPARVAGSRKQPKLISYRDEMARRMHLLENVSDMDPWKAEVAMLEESPMANTLKAPRMSAKTAKERSAQLQELMNFCATGGTTQTEIDHAFKQFLLECMELTTVNEAGEVIHAAQPPALIPWEDAYSYFKGIAPRQDDGETEEEKRSSVVGCRKEGGRSSTKLSDQAPSETRPSHGSATQRGERTSQSSAEQREAQPSRSSACPSAHSGILKSPSVTSSVGCTRKSSVHFETDAEGHPLPQPGDDDDDDTPPTSHSPLPTKSVDENMQDLINMRKRNLDQWCFAEHLEPAVFLQVLNEARYSHPFLDAYHHKRDRSVFLALSSPHNAQLQRKEDWHVWLHSNCGFRNYLEHVAHSIEDWTRDEEAKYQAKLLAQEVEQMRKAAAEEDGGSAPNSAKARSSSGGSSDRSPSHNPFVRAGTLKAMKEEMERQKIEDEEKEKEKEKTQGEKKSKSATKTRGDKEKLDTSRAKSTDSKISEHEDVEPIETEKIFPFTGYDVGNLMPHVSGRTTSLFPADGGHIRTEKTQFVQGESVVKVTVMKDGHQFVVHVVDPKDDPFANLEITTENNATSQSEAERKTPQDDRQAECAGSSGENVPSNEAGAGETGATGVSQDEKPNKPCVGHFGSFIGQFSDGLGISLSTYGAGGVPKNGEPYVPEAYAPPVARSPSPTGKASPVAKGKGKDKDKDKGKAAAVATPDPGPDEVEEELKEEEVTEAAPVVQPFQELCLTCPDGLKVQYVLESAIGIVPEDPETRKLVVKQSYPFKTGGKQPSETARRLPYQEHSRTIGSDGTVVKVMNDNSVVVLYADGKVSRLNDITALDNGTARNDSPTREGTRSVPPDPVPPTPSVIKDGKESKKKKDKDKSKNTTAAVVAKEVVEEKVEKEPVKKGEWETTLPSGERIRSELDGTPLPVQDLVVCTASDPMTKQVMYTREDHVVTVCHPDGTMIVEHSDGTRITTYSRQVNMGPAQSRETGEEIEPDVKLVKFVFVECPGYATLKFDAETTECSTEFGTGTIIHAFPAGNYDIYHCEGGYLQIDAEGRTVYFPRPNFHMEEQNQNQQLMYNMCHFSDTVLDVTDSEGNHFSVSNTGTCAVQTRNELEAQSTGRESEEMEKEVISAEQGEQERDEAAETAEQAVEKGEMDKGENEKSKEIEENGSKEPVEYKEHAPRFFIVHPDGSATELLRYQDLAEYVVQAEEDPSTAILMDPLADYSGVSGLTVLKPYLKGHSDRWLMNYAQASIIPEGLTSRDLKTLPAKEVKPEGPKFGTNVGQGLNIGGVNKNRRQPMALTCPEKLELRQLIQYRPVTEDLRDKLTKGVRDYAEFLKVRTEYSQALLVQDPRSEEERMQAAELQARVRSARTPPTAFTDDNRPASRLQRDVKSLYENATLPAEPEVPTTPKSKRSRVALERDKRELQEEQENRDALRNQSVPGYFNSELGKAFLVSQRVIQDAVSIVRGDRNEHDRIGEIPSEEDIQMRDVEQPRESRDYLLPSSASGERVEQSTSEPALMLQVPEASDRPFSDTPPLDSNPGALQPHQYDSPPPPRDFSGSDTGSSPLRPGNPTPGHAVGLGSPTALRPDNPTPAHAYKQPSNRPGSEEGEVPDMRTRVLETNVVGGRRGDPVRLPQYLYSSKPGAVPNTKFAYTEEPVRRKVFTSSIASAQLKTSRNMRNLRGFELLPDFVNFGILKEGNTYGYTVHLKNTGVDSCRFKITQPPPSTGLQVLFKPGPVAAGMKVELHVEIYAIAVGVKGGTTGVGSVSHNLEIITETDHLYLPITATVLTAQDYDARDSNRAAMTKSAGVRFLSNKPPSGQGSIRPQREHVGQKP